MSTEAPDGSRNSTGPPPSRDTQRAAANREAGRDPHSEAHSTGEKQAAENAENEPAG